MPTDGSNTTPTLEQDPAPYVIEVQPAELMAPQVVERYSIAEALQHMFEEADQASAEGWTWESAQWWEQEYPTDTTAFRAYMQEIYSELKRSPAVQELRQANDAGREVTVAMVEAVFRAYERSVQTAARRLRDELAPDQLQRLRAAGRDELDWNYRHLLVEHLTADAGAPIRYSVEDFFLILNPKARKIQYMETKEIVTTLRHSMARGSTDRLQHDVQTIRRFQMDANVQPVTESEEFAELETATT